MIQETKQIKSMSKAVITVIDGYPSGHQFFGNQLHNDVAHIYPDARNMYVDTLMRMMRRHCSSRYKTVNHNKSLYEKL